MKNVKILIADDMEIEIEAIKKVLEKINYIQIVGMAMDGQDEYDKILSLKPDIVFTDNKMPKMSGIEVIKLINNSKLEKKPKFVLVTGDVDQEIIKIALELNISNIIKKPFEDDLIVDIIEEYKEDIEHKNEVQPAEKKDINISLLQKIIRFFKGNSKQT